MKDTKARAGKGLLELNLDLLEEAEIGYLTVLDKDGQRTEVYSLKEILMAFNNEVVSLNIKYEDVLLPLSFTEDVGEF